MAIKFTTRLHTGSIMSMQVFQVLALQDYLLTFLHTSKLLVSTIGFCSIVFLATCYLDSFKQRKI